MNDKNLQLLQMTRWRRGEERRGGREIMTRRGREQDRETGREDEKKRGGNLRQVRVEDWDIQ